MPYPLTQDVEVVVKCEQAEALGAGIVGELNECDTVHMERRRRHQPRLDNPPHGADFGDGPDEVDDGDLGWQADDLDDTVVSHR